jgi:hypothetical protein
LRSNLSMKSCASIDLFCEAIKRLRKSDGVELDC